jgi:hypothetical protein
MDLLYGAEKNNTDAAWDEQCRQEIGSWIVTLHAPTRWARKGLVPASKALRLPLLCAEGEAQIEMLGTGPDVAPLLGLVVLGYEDVIYVSVSLFHFSVFFFFIVSSWRPTESFQGGT